MSKGESGKATDDRSAGGLVQRLIQTISGQRSAPGPELETDSTLDGLPPAGRRSGRGAASVAPYLNQFRNTRPAWMDD